MNFGLDGSQFRKHVGLSDLVEVNSENMSELTPIKFEIPACFRN